jgi:lipopolysaccharide transport system ATP-binding protein
MSTPAIRLEDVGKRYRLHSAPSSLALASAATRNALRRVLKGKRAPQPTADHYPGEFWALRGITLDIEEGDVVGVVGRNGAGKSTLLKILSRITPPTTGQIEIRGRVGSLLEVGTGFNPELSGRENVYLSAAILGMKGAEIKAEFDRIVEFSGVESFLDMPVKHYSSGMYMRLAFAVAAHLRHEILLIDEVLAVGDAAFQQKCIGRLNDEASSGRTVLFVSHNMAAVLSLCNKALLLQDGRNAKTGTPDDVVGLYLGQLSELRPERTWPRPNDAPGNRLFRVMAVRAVRLDGTPCGRFSNDQDWFVEIDYWSLVPGSKLGTTLAVYDRMGTCVFGSLSNLEPQWHGKPRPPGTYRSRVRIPGDFMKEGVYKIAILLWAEGYTDLFRLDEALEIEIFDSGDLRGDYFGGWEGVVHPRLEWRCERIAEDAHLDLNSEKTIGDT